eukprot:70407_1
MNKSLQIKFCRVMGFPDCIIQLYSNSKNKKYLSAYIESLLCLEKYNDLLAVIKNNKLSQVNVFKIMYFMKNKTDILTNECFDRILLFATTSHKTSNIHKLMGPLSLSISFLLDRYYKENFKTYRPSNSMQKIMENAVQTVSQNQPWFENFMKQKPNIYADYLEEYEDKITDSLYKNDKLPLHNIPYYESGVLVSIAQLEVMCIDNIEEIYSECVLRYTYCIQISDALYLRTYLLQRFSIFCYEHELYFISKRLCKAAFKLSNGCMYPSFYLTKYAKIKKGCNQQIQKMLCENCKNTTNKMKVCCNCMKAVYCSRKCQKIAWKSNHRVCCDKSWQIAYFLIKTLT